MTIKQSSIRDGLSIYTSTQVPTFAWLQWVYKKSTHKCEAIWNVEDFQIYLLQNAKAEDHWMAQIEAEIDLVGLYRARRGGNTLLKVSLFY